MRGRNQVMVTLAGDSDRLERAFAKSQRAMASFQAQAKKGTAGINFTGSMLDALGALPSQLKGAAIVAGGAIGAAMAPAVASAIISGTLLGVGSGALAAGIVAAARSPQVQNAFKKLGKQGERVFENFGKPFQQPLIRAANTFSAALKRSEKTILAIGKAIAPVVDKLAPALAGMAENALPGILAATQASVPLFDVLARNLPGIGTAVTQLFTAFAAGGPMAADWLSRFLKFTQELIPKLAGVVVWVQSLGPKIQSVSDKLTPLKDAFTSIGQYIMTGFREAGQFLLRWYDQNREKVDKFIGQVSGFVKDLGPAFRLAILGIAFSFALTASNVMLLVDALDRLKRWYHSNAGWLKYFSGLHLLGGGGGGASFGNIPKFHSGGVMPGAPGSEGLALLQAGEAVLPAGQGGGSTTLALSGASGSDMDRLMAAWITRLVRTGQLKLVRV